MAINRTRRSSLERRSISKSSKRLFKGTGKTTCSRSSTPPSATPATARHWAPKLFQASSGPGLPQAAGASCI